MKTAISTEKTAAKNLRLDFISIAVEVLGIGETTAGKMSTDDIVASLRANGFDEESTYGSLVDDYGFGNMNMERDISELCLPALVALWIECKQAEVVKVESEPKAEPKTKAASAERQSYGVSPRSIISEMVTAAMFTRAQIKAAVLERVPGVKQSYINTALTRIVSTKNPLFKTPAVVDANTGIVSWA